MDSAETVSINCVDPPLANDGIMDGARSSIYRFHRWKEKCKPTRMQELRPYADVSTNGKVVKLSTDSFMYISVIIVGPV